MSARVPLKERAAQQSNADAGERFALLIVDDELPVLDALEDRYRDRFRLLRAQSGAEAVAVAREHHPAVVILDILMPGMDGVVAHRELRKIDPNIQVIFNTAHEGEYPLEEILGEWAPAGFIGKMDPSARLDGFVKRGFIEYERLSGGQRGQIVLQGASVPQEAGERLAGYRVRVTSTGDETFETTSKLVHQRQAVVCVAGHGLLPQETVLERIRSAYPDLATVRIPQEADVLQALEGQVNQFERTLDAARGSLKGRNVLVTGTSGFIGKRFLADLLRRDPEVRAAVVVRSEEAEKKALDGLSEGERQRVRAVRWDLADDYPGARKKLPELGVLEKQVEEIWHFAGSTDFEAEKSKEIFLANVLGTHNLLDFAQRCPALRCFNFVSTAYTAGREYYREVTPEAVKSGGVPLGKNPYETSKLIAEKLVEGATKLHQGRVLRYRIFRPSIVVGDTRTGESDRKVVYGFIKGLSQLKRRMLKDGADVSTPIRVLGENAAFKDLVPVNVVVETLLALRDQDRGPNAVYPITNSKRLTLAEMMDVVREVVGLTNVAYVNPLPREGLSAYEAIFNSRAVPVFGPYLTVSDPLFVRRSTDDALRAVGREDLISAADVSKEQFSFLMKSFMEGK